MTSILANWGNTKDYPKTEVHQRGEDGYFIQQGKDYGTTQKKYEVDRHNPTGSFFPHTTDVWSLGQDALYIAAFPFHKVATAAGKVGLTFWDTGVACKTALYDQTEKFSDAARPAFRRLKTLGKDAAVLAVPLALRYWQPSLPLLGWSACNTLCYTAAAAAGAYALYNPKGMKVQVADLEDKINIKPLSDSRVAKLSNKRWAFSLLDGSYSLSRLLGMHRLGKSTDKVGDKPKFEYVSSDKKS